MKAVIIYHRAEKSYEVIDHNLGDARAESKASDAWTKGLEAYAVDQPVKHRGRPKNCDLCRQLAVDYITTQVSFSPAIVPDVQDEAAPLRPEFILGDIGVSRRIEAEPDELDRKIDLGIAIVRRLLPVVGALVLIVIIIALALGPFRRLIEKNETLANILPPPTSTGSAVLAGLPENSAAATVSPTEKPTSPPTAIKAPTNTPTLEILLPTPTFTLEPPTATPENTCIDAAAVTLDYVGQTICVQGTVVRSYYQEPAYYLIFSNDWVSFYLISYDLRLDHFLPGDCVRTTGTVQKLQTDPIMVLKAKDVLEACETP